METALMLCVDGPWAGQVKRMPQGMSTMVIVAGEAVRRADEVYDGEYSKFTQYEYVVVPVILGSRTYRVALLREDIPNVPSVHEIPVWNQIVDAIIDCPESWIIQNGGAGA